MDINLLCKSCMKTKSSADIKCPKCGFVNEDYKSPLHHLPLNTILNGKYLLGKVLGEGGFGITYLGWDLLLDLKVAIKEYYPNTAVTRDHNNSNTVNAYTGESLEFYLNGKDKFINEAKSLAKFYSLPSIVAVKDFFSENGTAYIVMEFIDGETLKDSLIKSGGRLPPKTVLELMKPLIRSLTDVHKTGMIHRDISPDNIMIDTSGNVKLLDFGAARDVSSDGKSLSILLKPGYAPEEQYRTRGHQGAWSDVYAMCATMYRAITGQPPLESLERLREDGLQPPTAFGIKILPMQEAALMKGLAVIANDRLQDMEELWRALYEFPEETPVAESHKAVKKDKSNSPLLLTALPSEYVEKKIEQKEKPAKKDKAVSQEKRVPKNKAKKKSGLTGVIVVMCVCTIATVVVLGFKIWEGNAYIPTNDNDVNSLPSQSVPEIPDNTPVVPPPIVPPIAPPVDAGNSAESKEIIWKDNVLEAYVRVGIGKPTGTITEGDISSITELEIAGQQNSYIAINGDVGVPADFGEIQSLEDIRHFKNLYSLTLDSHAVSDVSPLADVTDLMELTLKKSSISDISSISNLVNLKMLTLFDNQIQDLTPLSSLTDLNYLDLGYNLISDVSQLSNLTNLNYLNLDSNQIVDISPLSYLESLSYLNLDYNQISDLEPLEELEGLNSLRLSYNQAEDVTPLTNLLGLNVLDLNYNQIEDVSAISNLTNLSELYLNYNYITDVTALVFLVNLQKLYLEGNPIEDFSVLGSLTNLEIFQ